MSHNPMKVLVTGSRSGLGKHCLAAFSGVGLTRETSFSDIEKKAANQPFDLIIHAAFNAKPGVHTDNLPAYLNDTLLLTEKLLTLPHQQFVFISSVDVYPNDGRIHQEDENISMDEVKRLYAVSKLMSESLVTSKANLPLILRCSAMLGQSAKPNSLIKLLTETSPKLTLAEESTFNYILHDDVVDVIRHAAMTQSSGIFNLASASEISLKAICQQFGKSAEFGKYCYESTKVSNEKISALHANFKRTSLENIQRFIKYGLQMEIEA